MASQRPQGGKTSLRIDIAGTILQTFNMCCWITTIICGSVLLIPLFFFCCDWWKRKTLQTLIVDLVGYAGVAKMIQYTGATQVYLTVQDNYFSQAKAQILIQAISKAKIQNFTFINTVEGFDALENNYSEFDKYMRPILQYVKHAEISWARKVVR